MGDQRSDGESSCNSGDGTGQMAQPWMFKMMMMILSQLQNEKQWINLCGNFFFCGANRACTASFFRFLDYTKTHLNGWIPLKEVSAGGKARYLHNTHRTKETKIHALSGIRNRNPSIQTVQNSRRRPQGHLERHEIYSWL